jgi:hypothetical protein
MKKICSSCNLERDAEKDFCWEYKNKGIRSSRCKYCQSELSRLHYQKHKQVYKARTHKRKAQVLIENKPLLYQYLSTHPCIDCNESDIRLLEFDHVHLPKLGEISDLLRQGHSWATIANEITKCEVRCANCHRLKTFESGYNWRNNKDKLKKNYNYEQIYTYLLAHPCVDCGTTDIRLLEFDHIEGQKINTISRMLAQKFSWPAISAEIAKCEVRCANCHRIKTDERGGFWRGLFKASSNQKNL